MLKSDFFSTGNFNIFYNLEPSRFSKSPLRARTWPEKNPPKQIKIFISEINFSISEVENLDFQLKKEERTQHVRVLSSSLYKDTTFFGEIQIALTFEHISEMLKCSDLQQTGSVWCYITRDLDAHRLRRDRESVRNGEKCTAPCFCKV